MKRKRQGSPLGNPSSIISNICNFVTKRNPTYFHILQLLQCLETPCMPIFEIALITRLAAISPYLVCYKNTLLCYKFILIF